MSSAISVTAANTVRYIVHSVDRVTLQAVESIKFYETEAVAVPVMESVIL
jgi:hypothetical protein